jgi:hypothetical protein
VNERHWQKRQEEASRDLYAARKGRFDNCIFACHAFESFLASASFKFQKENGGPSFPMGRARGQPHDDGRLDSAYDVSSAFIHFPDIALNAHEMKSPYSGACLSFDTKAYRSQCVFQFFLDLFCANDNFTMFVEPTPHGHSMHKYGYEQ